MGPVLDSQSLIKLILSIRFLQRLRRLPLFWVVLVSSVIFRLITITQSPLETSHNWRQAVTNMIARNFSQIEFNPLFPRIDYAGELTGIIGSEFPLFNILIFFANELFGHDHWYGRLINLILSSLGVLAFFGIMRRSFDKKAAIGAASILCTSIWFAFSRKVMPDTFSVSLVLIGIYYGFRFYDHPKWGRLLLCGIFLTLGGLSKMPALLLVAAFGFHFLKYSLRDKKLALLLITGIASIISVGLWYYAWVPYLIENYQYELFFPKSLYSGLMEISSHIPQLLERFYFDGLKSYMAFAAVLAGSYFTLKSKQHVYSFLLLILGCFFLILKTGAVFPLHDYYIIPFVPVLAALAGIGLSKLKPQLLTTAVVLISIEAVVNQIHDFKIPDKKKYLLNVETNLNDLVSSNSKIIVNGGDNPITIYFLNRRGWSESSENLYKESFLSKWIDSGATHLIWDKHQGKNPEFMDPFFENEHLALYDLTDGYPK